MIEHFTLRSSRAARPAQATDARALEATLAEAHASLELAYAQWVEADAKAALAALDEAERTFARALASTPALTRAAAPYGALDEDARRTIATFGQRAEALSRALERVRPATRSALANLATLAARWAVVIAAATVVTSSVRAMVERAAVKVTASATWGAAYPPDNVSDHNPSTTWLLPDGTLGWIETSFARRSVRAVKLTSPQRLPSYGARLCTVELKRRGAIVYTREIDAGTAQGQRAPYVLTLATPVEADAVRVHVRSFHGLGGGFSEIDAE